MSCVEFLLKYLFVVAKIVIFLLQHFLGSYTKVIKRVMSIVDCLIASYPHLSAFQTKGANLIVLYVVIQLAIFFLVTKRFLSLVAVVSDLLR